MIPSMLIAAAVAGAEVPSLPEWMAGCWESQTGDRWTEECWSKPRGKMMIGYSRSGTGGRVTEWESMQILLEDETDDPAVVPIAFWAAPGGINRTMFAWAESKEPGVSFYNMANDYPQRIRYWRDGEDLMAEISLRDGGNARRWRYRPTKP